MVLISEIALILALVGPLPESDLAARKALVLSMWLIWRFVIYRIGQLEEGWW